LFEVCALKLKTVASSLGICCIYRAPSGNINQVLELLDVILECSLRSGWSGDHIPVWGADSPHPLRPALGHTQPPIRWIPGHSRG